MIATRRRAALIHWLRRSSPTRLACNDPEIRVQMKYPG
jgi:hypothetical protein